MRKRLEPKITRASIGGARGILLRPCHQTSLLPTCYPSCSFKKNKVLANIFSLQRTSISRNRYTVIVKQTSHCASTICYKLLKMMLKTICFLGDYSDICGLFAGEERKTLAPTYDTVCLLVLESQSEMGYTARRHQSESNLFSVLYQQVQRLCIAHGEVCRSGHISQFAAPLSDTSVQFDCSVRSGNMHMKPWRGADLARLELVSLRSRLACSILFPAPHYPRAK